MMVNFNHAKKVAAGCLAMSSCPLFLWLNQTGIQADQVMTGQSVTTSQLASNQGTNNSTGGQTHSLIDPQDHGNYACLDQAQVNSNGSLTVAGWHAANATQGRPYHYLIVYDPAAHREISR